MSFVQKRCLRNHNCGTINSHLYSIDYNQRIVMGNHDTTSQPSISYITTMISNYHIWNQKLMDNVMWGLLMVIGVYRIYVWMCIVMGKVKTNSKKKNNIW
eukprot:494228_1